jgi:FMN phosphatase YigB (HAD superfamily)
MLKRVFFDFGGCIDAPGIHTRTLFWEAFLAERLLGEEMRAQFQEAYTEADRRMMGSGEAVAMGLKAFNQHNARLIGQALSLPSAESARAGDRVSGLMSEYLRESREALELFRGQYELSVISNFTGNLELIMQEFRLRDFFGSVTESFYVGASKPDPRIFREALRKHTQAPDECMYVGDNPVNDIAPAKEMGMRAALIHPPGKRRECGADHYVESLRDLFSEIQSK